MTRKTTLKNQTTSKTKTTIVQADSADYNRFYSAAQHLFRVPKKEIDEQEKIYKAQKEKAKN